MNLENEYGYLSFLKSWNSERYVMTQEEINELVRDLAKSYYLALSENEALLNRCQIRLLEKVKVPS